MHRDNYYSDFKLSLYVVTYYKATSFYRIFFFLCWIKYEKTWKKCFLYDINRLYTNSFFTNLNVISTYQQVLNEKDKSCAVCDDRYSLTEQALQHVSMVFRSEKQWDVVEPLPDMGWRLRKNYILVKPVAEPKQRQMLSWVGACMITRYMMCMSCKKWIMEELLQDIGWRLM